MSKPYITDGELLERAMLQSKLDAALARAEAAEQGLARARIERDDRYETALGWENSYYDAKSDRDALAARCAELAEVLDAFIAADSADWTADMEEGDRQRASALERARAILASPFPESAERDALANRCAELADAMRQLRDADIEARSTESPQRAAQIVEGAWLAVDRVLDRALPASAERIRRIVEAATRFVEMEKRLASLLSTGAVLDQGSVDGVRDAYFQALRDLRTAIAPEVDRG